MTERYSTDVSIAVPINDTTDVFVDIVVIGGGVAGLWLLNRLQQQGYQVLLLENSALGDGQTIASQGIIHGGLKYALNGTLDGAASAIASMPNRWHNCLRGKGEIDLSSCELESEHYYMWSESSFRSRVKTFLGSKSLQGRIEAVPLNQFPAFFQQSLHSGKKGSLYRLPDFVLDTSSLLATLSAPYRDRIVKIAKDALSFQLSDRGHIDNISIATGGKSVTIGAQRFIFAAGEGNQKLLDAVNNSSTSMQTRPLQMVYIKKTGLPSLYVHCISNDFSLTPKLTVTSHLAADGDQVWYLGGELAESGVDKSSTEQIATAKSLLDATFPWLDFSGARWQCFSINRAEAKMQKGHRPDQPFISQSHNMIVSWPTKMTLTPALADDLLKSLHDDAIAPIQHENQMPFSEIGSPVSIAKPRWEQ